MCRKLDYKKEYKDLYFPKDKPSLVTVPPMNFIMIDGIGDPNSEEFEKSVSILYGLCFTIKMSKFGKNKPSGYLEYVMPPLEGLWWMKGGGAGIDYKHKENFSWVAMIRQPEFVTSEVFTWACSEVKKKKGLDTSRARLEIFDEGLCVQCMHIGSFDDEPATVEKLEQFIAENRLINDISDKRRHHEIYLSDMRKCDILKMKTVLRHPVKYKD